MKRNRYALLKLKIKAMIVTVALLVCSVPSVSHATSSTLQQLTEAEKNKTNLEKQQKENKEKLENMQGIHSSLEDQLEELNEQIIEIAEKLNELDAKITAKEEQIEETQAELADARATESWQYDCMEKRIQFNYVRGDKGALETILGAGSLGSMLNQAVFFESVAQYDNDMLDEIVATRQLIEEEEIRLELENEELNALKLEQEIEKNRVTSLISEKSKTLAKYADQITAKEKEIAQKAKEIQLAEEDLAALRKKYKEELALSQLAANSKWRDISEVEFAEGDRYLLANLIYCEAGGEPYAGQLAVGAVVINRVLSSRYPNTVTGVIYQKSQFSPTLNGHLASALAINKATNSCYKAADEAMAGTTNVGNCVYFRTPIEGLTGITIGGHIFY